jgi:hypothetical protein
MLTRCTFLSALAALAGVPLGVIRSLKAGATLPIGAQPVQLVDMAMVARARREFAKWLAYGTAAVEKSVELLCPECGCGATFVEYGGESECIIICRPLYEQMMARIAHENCHPRQLPAGRITLWGATVKAVDCPSKLTAADLESFVLAAYTAPEDA